MGTADGRGKGKAPADVELDAAVAGAGGEDEEKAAQSAAPSPTAEVLEGKTTPTAGHAALSRCLALEPPSRKSCNNDSNTDVDYA